VDEFLDRILLQLFESLQQRRRAKTLQPLQPDRVNLYVENGRVVTANRY